MISQGVLNISNRQEQAPLLSGLLQHIQRESVPFHIPGHKKGQGMDPEFKSIIGSTALAMDLVNIAPLDDLHHPHGIIKEAQMLAAEAFGADRTFFSVQGTSGAIMTMVLSTCGPGDKILVPRNIHKSFLTAIILSGARPVFMQPELDHELGVAHGVSSASVRGCLAQHPDAKALLLINPTYFGVCADLRSIVMDAHSYGIPVLVDEAHGVHLNFHERLPLSAMQAGADMAATSVHKLGGSLIQSSVLNIKGHLINPARVQTVFSMLTTTSTSYLLLASLDAARRHLALYGHELLDKAIHLAEMARNEINKMPGLWCLGPEMVGDRSSSYDLDVTKLCISVKGLGITGIEIEQLLREKFNVEVELSDLYNILCMVTLADNKSSVSYLLDALRRITSELKGRRSIKVRKVQLPETPELVLTPRDAFYSSSIPVPLEKSAGCVAAESIMVYPPGIPILMPGERISQTNIDYIMDHLKAGLPVQGLEDESFSMIRVVDKY
jgi:arginine decarboxylase